MFLTLLKKQIAELNAFFFINPRTGKKRKTLGIIGFGILLLIVFASMSFAFVGIGVLFCETFIALKLEWFYFALTAISTTVLGAFGSVFTTYTSIYRAKDNELLFSMPIKPSSILCVRILGTYLYGLLFSALAYIPMTIIYWVNAKPDATVIIADILLFFILGLFISVFTCLLGYLVALVSSKFKNKSFATVLFTLAFLGIYYFFYFNIQKYLNMILKNADVLSDKFKNYGYIVYMFGNAATGDLTDFLLITLINILLFVLLFFIMSKTYIKTVFQNNTNETKLTRKQEVKLTDKKSALLKREFSHFLASPAYMLNMGLSLIIVPAMSVFGIIKAETVREMLPLMSIILPKIKNPQSFSVVVAIAVVIALNGLSCYTAASVSIEGKNIWILKSLPLTADEIYNSKIKFHLILNSITTLIASLSVAFIIKTDFTSALLILICSLCYIWFSALLGLFLNLKFPNFTWKNETVAVKQGLPVAIMLFGSWFVSVALCVGYYFINDILDMQIFVSALIVVFAVLIYLLRSVLKNKGEIILKNL